MIIIRWPIELEEAVSSGLQRDPATTGGFPSSVLSTANVLSAWLMMRYVASIGQV
jgi:hypothetical protein